MILESDLDAASPQRRQRVNGLAVVRMAGKGVSVFLRPDIQRFGEGEASQSEEGLLRRHGA